jgi:hypothetical protein
MLLQKIVRRARGLADELATRLPTQPWRPPHGGAPSFSELSETPPDADIPVLDRTTVDEAALSPDQLAWRRDGVVIKPGLLNDAVLDPYIAVRSTLPETPMDKFRSGWGSATPYEHVPELRRVCLDPALMGLMESLIGEPMLLHLNLTGWVSTERNWHQDDYLNPAHVNSWYAAVWIALGDVVEDAGPFEYIPGSHRWPLLRQTRVKAWMSPEELARRSHTGAETWPKDSERFVVPAIENEIATRGVPARRFIAKKGDVLVWHGRLMHRGTEARDKQLLRPALIAHYSGVNHRDDMSKRAYDEAGSAYALFGRPLV